MTNNKKCLHCTPLSQITADDFDQEKFKEVTSTERITVRISTNGYGARTVHLSGNDFSQSYTQPSLEVEAAFALLQADIDRCRRADANFYDRVRQGLPVTTTMSDETLQQLRNKLIADQTAAPGPYSDMK